jgi:hypothetical protein
LIFFTDAPKISYKNNEDIVHSRIKGGGETYTTPFEKKKKKKMRRKPELSDSTLRWKGTEPTASTVKNKNRKQLTENVRETPTLIGSRTIILHDFTQFLRHGSARISFEKKNIHILHA